MSTRIGFIGTGSMGAPIAGALQRAGHDLAVHDRRRAAARDLTTAGATWCSSPAELARDADVIFLSLPSHVEVEQVCVGPAGLLSSVRPETYLIDLSTVALSHVSRMLLPQRSYGIRYLTAPVSQGVAAVAARKLSIFVGGAVEDVHACWPLLESIAGTVVHTGDQASAVAAKLLTNLLWYVNAAAIGEALVLGAKAGIDLPVLRQVILDSCGTSWVAEHDIPAIYDGTYDPSFTTALCCKDLALIGEFAARYGVPVELAATVEQIFRRTRSRYGGEAPELSVVKHLQELTATVLQCDLAEEVPGWDEHAGGWQDGQLDDDWSAR